VAESWRITDEESLFDYGDGESTETFTDLDYPSERVTVDDLDPDIRTRAEAVCAAAGLSEPAAVEDCVFDYGITGSTAFIESAQQFQAFLLGQRAFNLPGSEWTGKIDGATLEGDTTANDELYLVPTADGDDNLALHALDVAGGSTRWTAPDVEPGCRPAFLPVGDIVAQLRNGTPTAGDGPNSDLVVLDQNTGEILDRWEVPEGEPALARCSPGHITTSNEGMVVLNDPGGLVRAFTTADGLALAWSVDTGASAPALPIVGDSAYVLAREDGNAVVKRLSLADGSVESSVTLEATDIERTATGLTVTEGGVAVLTRSPDGVTYVEDDDGELSEVWTVDLTDPDEPLDGRFTQLATLYDLLVGWTGTTVVALSIEDGSVAWGYEPGRGPSTNGAVAASPDVGAVVGTVGGNFLEFISATGELEVAIEGIEGVSEAMTIGPIVNRATLVAARSTGDDRSVIVASVID